VLACAAVGLPSAAARGEASAGADASVAVSLAPPSGLHDPVSEADDLPRSFPALEIHTPFITDPNLYIRGLGQQHWYDNFTAPVAIYQDGVYATSSVGQLLESFDLANASVLEGPQGSLYARNATVGALLLNSNLPDGELSSRASVSYGNYDAVAVDGAVGFPILGKRLSGRIAGTAHFRNGVTRNQCAGAPGEAGVVEPRCDLLNFIPPNLVDRFPLGSLGDFNGLQRWTNDVHNWAGRGLLRFQPDDGQDWVLKVHGARNRGDSRHLQMLGTSVDGINVVGFSEDSAPRFDRDPFVGWYDQDGTDALDRLGASLTGHVDLGAARLVSITGYWRNDQRVQDEGDAMPGVQLAEDWSDETWQLSQDIHLEDAGAGYRWRVGSELLYEADRAERVFKLSTLAYLAKATDQSLLSFAPYLHGRWQLSPRFDVELGTRFVWERRRAGLDGRGELWSRRVLDASLPASDPARYASGWASCCARTRILETLPHSEASNISAAPTGELRLDFTPTDDLRFYLQFTRGYKGAQFYGWSKSDEASIVLAQPELANGGEAGVRSVWLDGALGFDAAVFYTQYRDMQVFKLPHDAAAGVISYSIPVNTRELLNADARAYGVDANLTARPLPGLFAQLGFGWLDAQYQRFTEQKRLPAPPFKAGGGSSPLSGLADYSGHPLVGAPRFRLAGRVDYELRLAGLGSVRPGLGFRYRSKVYFSPEQKEEVSQRGYWVLDAQLAYRPPGGRVEITGFVRNFLNEQYRTDAFDASSDTNEILYVYADPRLFGGRVTFSW
jgi:iron complex outermembrane recepter protein